MLDVKTTDYYALFIIACDPDYKTKYDLGQDELDFIDLVLELRREEPE